MFDPRYLVRRSTAVFVLSALTLLIAAPSSSAAPASAWASCLRKRPPNLSVLGAPVPPGAKLNVGDSAGQFYYFYKSRSTRAYYYRVEGSGVVAWYLARLPYTGGAKFTIPSVQRGSITLECETSGCNVTYGYIDQKPRFSDFSCPPELGQNTVDMSKAPAPAGGLADGKKCAGFNGFFMTDFGPMQLTNGKGTYTYRNQTDNSIDGTVTPTAKGWNLDGTWRDANGQGPFHFEMDRASGSFFGTNAHEGSSWNPVARPNSFDWTGQCRATMPTELSTNDDKATRDLIAASPTLVPALPPTTAKPGSFTPLDPATVPCGGFSGHFWSPSTGDLTLAAGVGSYVFGKDPPVAVNGVVTPTPTGWSLRGSYGSGATGGTFQVEQDNTGRAVGRYTATSGSNGVWNLSCVPTS